MKIKENLKTLIPDETFEWFDKFIDKLVADRWSSQGIIMGDEEVSVANDGHWCGEYLSLVWTWRNQDIEDMWCELNKTGVFINLQLALFSDMNVSATLITAYQLDGSWNKSVITRSRVNTDEITPESLFGWVDHARFNFFQQNELNRFYWTGETNEA